MNMQFLHFTDYSLEEMEEIPAISYFFAIKVILFVSSPNHVQQRQ